MQTYKNIMLQKHIYKASLMLIVCYCSGWLRNQIQLTIKWAQCGTFNKLALHSWSMLLVPLSSFLRFTLKNDFQVGICRTEPQRCLHVLQVVTRRQRRACTFLRWIGHPCMTARVCWTWVCVCLSVFERKRKRKQKGLSKGAQCLISEGIRWKKLHIWPFLLILNFLL